MAVSYQAALDALQAMFEQMDREVIMSVLDANQGHMEATIDQLLILSGEKVENPTRPPAPSGLPDPSDQVKQDEILARMIQERMIVQSLRAQGGMAANYPLYNVQAPLEPILPDLGVDISQDLKRLGSAVKLKLREWTQKLRRASPVDPAAQPLAHSGGESDETAVLNSTSTVSRRGNASRAVAEDDGGSCSSDEADEIPLAKGRLAMLRRDVGHSNGAPGSDFEGLSVAIGHSSKQKEE